MSNDRRPHDDKAPHAPDRSVPPPQADAVDEVLGRSGPAGKAGGGADVASGETLRRELDAANERTLRCQAELENYRKRAQREMADERRYALMPLLRDLLPVLDNMHRAVDAAEKTTSGEALLEGFRLVIDQLEGVLRRHDCVPIPALEEPFNPHFHQAIVHQPSEYPAGTITYVTQVGYQLHDRVVRPSQVIVSSGPATSG